MVHIVLNHCLACQHTSLNKANFPHFRGQNFFIQRGRKDGKIYWPCPSYIDSFSTPRRSSFSLAIQLVSLHSDRAAPLHPQPYTVDLSQPQSYSFSQLRQSSPSHSDRAVAPQPYSQFLPTQTEVDPNPYNQFLPTQTEQSFPSHIATVSPNSDREGPPRAQKSNFPPPPPAQTEQSLPSHIQHGSSLATELVSPDSDRAVLPYPDNQFLPTQTESPSIARELQFSLLRQSSHTLAIQLDSPHLRHSSPSLAIQLVSSHSDRAVLPQLHSYSFFPLRQSSPSLAIQLRFSPLRQSSPSLATHSYSFSPLRQSSSSLATQLQFSPLRQNSPSPATQLQFLLTQTEQSFPSHIATVLPAQTEQSLPGHIASFCPLSLWQSSKCCGRQTVTKMSEFMSECCQIAHSHTLLQVTFNSTQLLCPLVATYSLLMDQFHTSFISLLQRICLHLYIDKAFKTGIWRYEEAFIPPPTLSQGLTTL